MRRILAAVLVVLVPLMAWLAASLWDRVSTPADAPARLLASPALTEASIETLCRPPGDAETVRWDIRPFENAELLAGLKATPEGQRVLRIRQIYLKVLGRDPFDGDCAAVREWVDRPVGLEQIERQIAASAEARRVSQVRQVFIDTLGRDPSGWDNASLRRWVESESTPAEIEAQLMAQRPLVGAHYFTWYQLDQSGWGNDATHVQADAPQPAIGRYTSSDAAVMDTQIDQMARAGFDFVIVNVTAGSAGSWENAHRFFSRVARRTLKAAVMLDGLYAREAPEKATWVAKVKAEFTRYPNYFWHHDAPLILLFAARLNFAAPGVVLRNVYWTNSYGPGSNTFNLDYFLYPRDWPFWAATPQPLVNGVVPVVPGYVDTHLNRAEPMEYARNNGQMYHDQWQRALALRPELIIVYSWNEYFEQTAIEPTVVWGDRYLQWTTCYISHAHAGTAGPCR